MAKNKKIYFYTYGLGEADIRFCFEQVQIDEYGYHLQWKLSFRKDKNIFASWSVIGNYDINNENHLSYEIIKYLESVGITQFQYSLTQSNHSW